VCVFLLQTTVWLERELHLLKTKRTHSREQDEQNVDRGRNGEYVNAKRFKSSKSGKESGSA